MYTAITAVAIVFSSAVAIPATAEALPPAKIGLIETNWKGVQKLVASHKGKVVVVDIWTMTCPACIKKFPDFVALRKLHKHRIALISVNCDYDGIPGKPPKHYRAGVLKFLKQQNADFDNVLLTMPLIGFLNAVKLESTPAMYVYDKTGKLAKRFDNDKAVKDGDEFTTQQVRELVAKLINQ